MSTAKFAEHRDMFLSLKRCVVTDSNMIPDQARPGQLRRVGYRGGIVWNITNVKIDGDGIQFDFDGPYATKGG
jgi:hypothetical protein